MISGTYFKTKSSNQVEPCSWGTIGTAICCYYTLNWIKLRCNVINNNWYFKQKFYNTSFLKKINQWHELRFHQQSSFRYSWLQSNEFLNCSVDLYYFLLKKMEKWVEILQLFMKNQSGNYFYPMFYIIIF